MMKRSIAEPRKMKVKAAQYYYKINCNMDLIEPVWLSLLKAGCKTGNERFIKIAIQNWRRRWRRREKGRRKP